MNVSQNIKIKIVFEKKKIITHKLPYLKEVITNSVRLPLSSKVVKNWELYQRLVEFMDIVRKKRL